MQIQDDDKKIKIFIFCWHQKNWLPRAVIVDWQKLTEQMKDEIQLLLKTVGPLVQKNYHIEKDEKSRSTSYSLVNYTNVFENKIIESNESLDSVIGTWEHHSDNLHSYYFNSDPEFGQWQWIEHAYEYYINDENSNYTPLQLYKVLTSMTKLPIKQKMEQEDNNKNNVRTIFNSEFVVKHCILVSDVPVIENENIDMRPMRFFFKFLKHNQIDEKISEISIKITCDHQIPGTLVDLITNKIQDSYIQDSDIQDSDTQSSFTQSIYSENIVEIIKKNLKVSDVSLANSDYGFLTPIDMGQYKKFNNAVFQLNFSESSLSLCIFFM